MDATTQQLELTLAVDHEAEPADVVAALIEFAEAWLIEEEASASKPR